MKSSLFGLAALAAISALPLPAAAQKSTAEGIAEYRAMLADGNPAELYEAKGEALWKEARGPKNASLEKCDLGKGPAWSRALLSSCRVFCRHAACAGPGVTPFDLHGAAAGL
jgi:hypothetical protein